MRGISSRVDSFTRLFFSESLKIETLNEFDRERLHMTQDTTKPFVIIGMTALLFFSSTLLQAVERSELLSSMCVTCHGPDGKGANKIPKLKGLKVSDIIESMNGFKTGEESSTIMIHHAKGYTDKEIKLMAQYFSAK